MWRDSHIIRHRGMHVRQRESGKIGRDLFRRLATQSRGLNIFLMLLIIRILPIR